MAAHQVPEDAPFRPLPLLGNSHVQTILSNLWVGSPFRAGSVERLVNLDGGDRLLMYDSIPAGWQVGDRTALLVHGLCGSHQSGYIQRMAGQLLRRRWRVFRMDLRGGGRGIALARRPYHAGCSDDLRACLQEIQRLCPGSLVTLLGFSLGGNIVLKLAGELGNQWPALERVVAVAPPIDLERSSQRLALPRNRFYELHFLRFLVAMARRRQWFFPDLPRVRFPARLSLRLFDDLYTAPRCGFADAADYYRRAASTPLIPRITVPTLMVTARDDPIVAVEPFEELATPGHVEVRIIAHGGHLGFLGWDGFGGVRWVERRILDWLTASQ